MDTLITILFFASLIYGSLRPSWALAMIIFLFPLEQLMKVSAPGLQTVSFFFGKPVNYLIGIMSLLSLGTIILREMRPFIGFLNSATSLIILIIAWAMISIIWSQDRSGAIDMTLVCWPYFFLRILIAPLLIISIDELRKTLFSIIILGLCLSIFILTSPGFTGQWGRLGILEGTKMASNPLALGDLGGILVITAALFRIHNFGFLFNIVRFLAVLTGIVMVIQSGARGQVISCCLVSILLYPLSIPLKNVKNFILGLAASALFIIITSLAMSFLLDDIAAKRFSINELFYGASSVDVRYQNVVLLFNNWIQNPIYIIFGLGYFTFNSLSGGAFYSHVMIADFIFELGLPGLLFMILIFTFMIKSVIYFFGKYKDQLAIRTSLFALFGIILYLIIVANKQGDLWGSTPLYMFIAILGRLTYINKYEDGLLDENQ